MSDYFLDGLELEPIQQDNTAVKPITIIKPGDKVKKKGEYDPNSPYANIANILKYQAGKTAQIIADNTIVPVVKSAVDIVSNPKKYVEKVKDFAGDVADAYTVGTSGRTDNVKFKEGYGKELMDIANVFPLAAGAKKGITLGAKSVKSGFNALKKETSSKLQLSNNYLGLSDLNKSVLEEAKPFVNNYDNIILSNPLSVSRATNLIEQGRKKEVFDDFYEGSLTIDNFVKDYIKDLTSPEGIKRLTNQEIDYLKSIGITTRIPEKAELSAFARINEIKNIKNLNKKISDGNYDLDNLITNEKLYNNAFYRPPYVYDYMDDIILNKNIDIKDAAKIFTDPDSYIRVGEKSVPGETVLGSTYKKSKQVAAHEIGGHGLQAGRVLPLDNRLRKGLDVDVNSLNKAEEKAYDYFLKGSGGKEPSAFLHELRESMLQAGLIKKRYAPITPDLLERAKIYFQKRPAGVLDQHDFNFLSNTRILDFMDDTKSNYELISKELNKLPALIPGAIGLSALQNKQQGKEIASQKKYRQGGLIGDPPKIKTINSKKFIEKPKEAEAVIDSINENNTPTYRALNPLPTPTVRAYNVPSTKEKFETISNTIADKTKYTAGVYKDLFTGNLDNRIADYVYESVTPIGYDVNTAMQELKAGKRLPFKWDGQKTTFENFDKIDRWKNPETGKLDTYGKYVKEASDDGFNMYLRQKQKYNTFLKSDVKPSISKGEDIDYYKLNYDDDIFDEALYYGANKLNINDTLQIKDSAVGGFNLKNYTLSKGKDDKGTYISYYDKYDLEPTVAGYKIPVSAFMGKPYDIYGRMYYSQEGDNIKRIFPNKKYRLGGIIGDPPNTTPAQESTRVKPIIMTAPDIVNPSDTRMYDIMIKHYPYGSKSGRQRMLPGHIEAVYTTEDGTNLRWPRINSWKSGNEPVSTESNQNIKDKDIRVSYMKINADQFNKFFKEADTYEGEDYNLLTNNCADGICRALNVIPNEKTFGVTNPKYVMDAVNRDPRTYKTINQDKNVGVLQGVYNYLFN